MGRASAVIGVISDLSANWTRVLRGLRSVATAHHWLMELLEPADAQRGVVGDLRHDVVVVVGEDPTALHLRAGVPVIAVEDHNPDPGHPVLKVDDRAVGRVAAEHLLERGFRTLAPFGARGHPWFDARVAGFVDHAAARGAVVDGSGCAFDPRSPDERLHFSQQAIAGWASGLPKPVGVFVGCDTWSLMLSTACRAAGVQVPEEVALVGVDDDMVLCEFSIPQLSSVAAPWDRIGAMAGEFVLGYLRGRPPPPGAVLVPPVGVVTRQSSDVLAVEDPDVAAALRLIRQHAHDDLQINELVRMVAVDRHRLQAKFRQAVGRTMSQELHRVRLERAKQLLAHGDLPTSEVAARCGYHDASKLAHAFRAALGQTPTAYRRRYRA